MPSADLTSLDAILKEDYHPDVIKNTFNEENLALAFMEEEVQDSATQGRRRLIPKRIGRHYGGGSIPYRGSIPQPQRQAYADSLIGVRNFYFSVGWDIWTVEATRNRKGAYGEVMATEMTNAVEDAAFRRNAIAWGSGTGVLAQVNGAHVALATIELKNPGGVTGTILANRYIHGTANSGMMLAFLDSANPAAIKAVATVIDVNDDGTDITLDAPITVADNDFVVIAQTPTQNSYDIEPEGFLSMVDDGTYVANYHNINRAVVDVERSYVATNFGAMSLDGLQQLVDATSIRVGGSVDLFMGQHDVGRAYMALLEADKRYVGADLKSPDGGTKRAKKPAGKGAITFGDIPFLIERDAPFGMLFGMKKNTFLRLYWPLSGWADEGGGIVRWVDGRDEYMAFYRLFENFHCLEPARNFRAEGITTNALVVRSL